MVAGKGLANPTALLLSSLMMLRYVLTLHGYVLDASFFLLFLRHMNLDSYAAKIEKAALSVSSSPVIYLFSKLMIVPDHCRGQDNHW